MCGRWRGNGAHHLAKPAVGRILIGSRMPHRVEMHVAQLTRRVEDADSTRVSKLGDKSGRNGQYQLSAGQNGGSQHVVRHYDGVFTNSGAFSPAVMLGAVLEVGADAVMFSVDYPYESSYDAVQGFERTTLSGSDREKIARGNAERLLRIG